MKTWRASPASQPIAIGLRPLLLFAFLATACGTDRSDQSGSEAVEMGVSDLPILDVNNRYALLVGVARYPNAVHNLPSPREDLQAMGALLRTRFGFADDHIIEVADSLATRDTIIWAFRNHLSKANENGVALFYFVGHGLALDSNYSVKDKEETTTDQALFVWGSRGGGALLLDDELNVLIQELRAKRQIVIVDACNSGTAVKFWEGMTATDSIAPPGKSVTYVMSAGLSSRGNPAAFPSQFVSDSRTLLDPDSMSLVFLSGAQENRSAYSRENWPAAGKNRAVFTYFLTSGFQQSNGADSFLKLIENTRRQALNLDICLQLSQCQIPQLHGKLTRSSLSEIIGR